MIGNPQDDRADSSALGVLVVGVGRRGAERAAAAEQTRRLRLVAVFDRDPGRAAAVADRHGAVALPSLGVGLASSGIDVVVVATPPEDHARTIEQALRAGKQVLAEAPLTTRPRGGRILARRAAQAQVGLGTGFTHRFDPAVRDAPGSGPRLGDRPGRVGPR